MPYVRTRAISLKCLDFSETSQVVALITPDMGQVHVLAKGARRSTRDPRKSPWELLAHYDCVLAQRPRGRLHIAAEWKMLEPFLALRRDLRSFSAAFYGAEVVLASTTEAPEDGAAYGHLLDLLRHFEVEGFSEQAFFTFLLRVLDVAGWSPALDRCTGCGGDPGEGARFSPRSGGVLCADCGGRDPDALPMSRGAIAILKACASGRGGTRRIVVTPAQVHEIQRAFDGQIQYHLSRPLRTSRLARLLLAGEEGSR